MRTCEYSRMCTSFFFYLNFTSNIRVTGVCCVRILRGRLTADTWWFESHQLQLAHTHTHKPKIARHSCAGMAFVFMIASFSLITQFQLNLACDDCRLPFRKCSHSIFPQTGGKVASTMCRTNDSSHLNHLNSQSTPNTPCRLRECVMRFKWVRLYCVRFACASSSKQSSCRYCQQYSLN